LRVGSGAKAGGVLGVAAGLAVVWDWEDLELVLVGGLVVVAWACACGGGAEVGGDDEGVALVAGLVAGAAVAMPPAATAAARDELGGEAEGADWFMVGGVGVAPWAGGGSCSLGQGCGLLKGGCWENFGKTVVAVRWGSTGGGLGYRHSSSDAASSNCCSQR